MIAERNLSLNKNRQVKLHLPIFYGTHNSLTYCKPGTSRSFPDCSTQKKMHERARSCILIITDEVLIRFP